VAPRQINADRVRLFSDGVFAVLITILVLELKPPHADTFRALLPLWPTGLSYAVSYLFIAIVWVNHHHLFGYAEIATQRLMWFNFAHLFSVSLIPFATEWIAESRLAAAPVALYAAIFVLVNVTYLALCWEAVDRPAREDVSQIMRRLLRMRSFVTIGVFATAAVLALWWPLVGMGLICLCLVSYLRPDIPTPRAAEHTE
jgi:TMEM175 potassium channel family protein